MHSLFS